MVTITVLARTLSLILRSINVEQVALVEVKLIAPDLNGSTDAAGLSDVYVEDQGCTRPSVPE